MSQPDSSSRVLVRYHVNGMTQRCWFVAPKVTQHMADHGLHVVLRDTRERIIGEAMFAAGGVISLTGVAVEQFNNPELPGDRPRYQYS